MTRCEGWPRSGGPCLGSCCDASANRMCLPNRRSEGNGCRDTLDRNLIFIVLREAFVERVENGLRRHLASEFRNRHFVTELTGHEKVFGSLCVVTWLEKAAGKVAEGLVHKRNGPPSSVRWTEAEYGIIPLLELTPCLVVRELGWGWFDPSVGHKGFRLRVSNEAIYASKTDLPTIPAHPAHNSSCVYAFVDIRAVANPWKGFLPATGRRGCPKRSSSISVAIKCSIVSEVRSSIRFCMWCMKATGS